MAANVPTRTNGLFTFVRFAQLLLLAVRTSASHQNQDRDYVVALSQAGPSLQSAYS